MESPSSASPIPTLDDHRVGRVMVAGLGHPAASDDAASVARETGTPTLVVFVGKRLTSDRRRKLDDLVKTLQGQSIGLIAIVGSFRVHLDDPKAEEAERLAVDLLQKAVPGARVIVFRPGHLDSSLKRWASLWPMFPRWLTTCVLPAAELFAAIDSERLERVNETFQPGPGRAPGRNGRAFTLLGENIAWREALRRHQDRTRSSAALEMAARVLSWLLLGQLIAIAIVALTKLHPAFRALHVTTLRPRSFRELISLCHARNIDRVRVVGYNNGVHHFGHRYPGKTIVSTVQCGRTLRNGEGHLRADAGATIRAAISRLAETNEELFVVPNYSYVSLGTAFFVPIHGSAVDYATVADTITRVVLYDPDRDRIISAGRDDPDFAENVYNLKSRIVVLRLELRTRPRSPYYVRRETVTDATAEQLLDALRDEKSANVEIRQGHAASRTVTIARYSTGNDSASGPAMELPRDALGRLWDILEENPITSFLMHALARHVAWHTEIFFNAEEFKTFWRTHADVPLRKIQLRYIRRDGMPHSPFRDEDRVSADLFLFRPDKKRFDAYTAAVLPNVRYNPGKHSN